jgi:GTP diphosphokinase / guanosine-3',5'-bis(diphosphate) 3'-diphosphatase
MWLVLDAAHFAAAAHAAVKQTRKNAAQDPYINHPLGVAHLLMRGGVTDPEVLAGAVLHDTIEDTGTLKEEIASRFGEAVASYVDEVSDDKNLPKAERKRLQVVHAGSMSLGARLIKLADKSSNVEAVLDDPPVGWSIQRRRDYALWCAQVVDQVRGTHAWLERHFDALIERAKAELVEERPR